MKRLSRKEFEYKFPLLKGNTHERPNAALLHLCQMLHLLYVIHIYDDNIISTADVDYLSTTDLPWYTFTYTDHRNKWNR